MGYSKNALLMTLALSESCVVVCKKIHGPQQVETLLTNTYVVPGFLKTNKERLLAFSPSIHGHEEPGNLRSLQGETAASRRLETPPPCAIRAVKVSKNANHLHMAEVQAFAIVDGEEKNVALVSSAVASQSSTFVGNESDWGAVNAIDGITKPPTNDYSRGRISHTNKDDNAWWQVDFGALYEVKKVVIWNRRGEKGWVDKMLNARVELLDVNLNAVAYQTVDNLYNGTIPLDFDGDCDPQVWDIEFKGVSANFSLSSEEELVLKYDIGKYRQYNHTLLQSDCINPITDIDINTTATNQASDNQTHSLLILSHSIDKSNIANSSIWNASSSQVELCQKVQLYLPSAGSNQELFVLAEDIREIDIDFDLSTTFEINDNALGAATIIVDNVTTTVDSYIGACQCNGESLACSTPSPLVPNTELNVCIYSTSSDVQIEELDSMTIKQQESTKNLNVITEKEILFKSITSMKYVPNMNTAGGNGMKVTTRVPTNMFDYGIAGTKLVISGGVTMKLADGNTTRRELVAGVADISDGNEEASFELEVSLQQQLDSQEDPISSATSIAKNGYIVIGSMAFALLYAMW